MGSKLLVIVGILTVVSPQPVRAEGEPGPAGGGAADSLGFGPPGPGAAPAPRPQRDWSVLLATRTEGAGWTQRLDSFPLAKLRLGTDLSVRFKRGVFRLVVSGHAEYDFAYLVKGDRFDSPTVSTYERQIFPKEAYASLSVRSFDVIAGYQMVPWGHGELLSPLDIAMPRDLRETGLQEPSELRLPVLGTRLAYFRDAHRFELMAIHLPDFGLRPSPGSSFSPLSALFSTSEATAAGYSAELLHGRGYRQTTPEFNQQFLMRYGYAGTGVDLGIYLGMILDQQGVLVSSTEAMQSSDTIELHHDRFVVAGTSGSHASGWFSFNWELSADLARPLNVGQLTTVPQTIDSTRAYLINTMAGTSFTGVRDLRLTLELLKPWLVQVQNRTDWLSPPDRPMAAARASYSLFRERLQLAAVATFIGLRLEQGWVLRADASFVIRDGLKVNAGYITYNPGSEFGPWYGLTSHDRLYVGLRWDYVLL